MASVILNEVAVLSNRANTPSECGICKQTILNGMTKSDIKYGINSCEPCSNFVSEMLHISNDSPETCSSLTCESRSINNCELPPTVCKTESENQNSGSRCKACWLNVCIKTFNLPVDIKRQLSSILPECMRETCLLSDSAESVVESVNDISADLSNDSDNAMVNTSKVENMETVNTSINDDSMKMNDAPDAVTEQYLATDDNDVVGRKSKRRNFSNSIRSSSGTNRINGNSRSIIGRSAKKSKKSLNGINKSLSKIKMADLTRLKVSKPSFTNKNLFHLKKQLALADNRKRSNKEKMFHPPRFHKMERSPANLLNGDRISRLRNKRLPKKIDNNSSCTIKEADCAGPVTMPEIELNKNEMNHKTTEESNVKKEILVESDNAIVSDVVGMCEKTCEAESEMDNNNSSCIINETKNEQLPNDTTNINRNNADFNEVKLETEENSDENNIAQQISSDPLSGRKQEDDDSDRVEPAKVKTELNPDSTNKTDSFRGFNNNDEQPTKNEVVKTSDSQNTLKSKTTNRKIIKRETDNVDDDVSSDVRKKSNNDDHLLDSDNLPNRSEKYKQNDDQGNSDEEKCKINDRHQENNRDTKYKRNHDVLQENHDDENSKTTTERHQRSRQERYKKISDRLEYKRDEKYKKNNEQRKRGRVGKYKAKNDQQEQTDSLAVTDLNTNLKTKRRYRTKRSLNAVVNRRKLLPRRGANKRTINENDHNDDEDDDDDAKVNVFNGNNEDSNDRGIPATRKRRRRKTNLQSSGESIGYNRKRRKAAINFMERMKLYAVQGLYDYKDGENSIEKYPNEKIFSEKSDSVAKKNYNCAICDEEALQLIQRYGVRTCRTCYSFIMRLRVIPLMPAANKVEGYFKCSLHNGVLGKCGLEIPLYFMNKGIAYPTRKRCKACWVSKIICTCKISFEKKQELAMLIPKGMRESTLKRVSLEELEKPLNDIVSEIESINNGVLNNRKKPVVILKHSSPWALELINKIKAKKSAICS